MRAHPISLALRYLRGRRTMRAAPFHGRPLFDSPQEAAAALRAATGEDFGTDAEEWGRWLRQNKWVYYHSPGEPRGGRRGEGPPGRKDE